MSVKDDLIAAKALICTPEKWGKRYPIEGPRLPCALEAIRLVERPASVSYTDMRAYPAMLDALPGGSKYRRYVDGQPFLGGYNDDPDTTHADVMTWFDRAIASLTTSDPS